MRHRFHFRGLKYYLPLVRKHVSHGCEDFHCQKRIAMQYAFVIVVRIDNLSFTATQSIYHLSVVMSITANHDLFFLLFKTMLCIYICITRAKFALYSEKLL